MVLFGHFISIICYDVELGETVIGMEARWEVFIMAGRVACWFNNRLCRG